MTNKDQAKYWYEEGVKLHDAGRYDEAIAYYDKVLRINPRSVQA
jgi:tetratricopeptide (TPR) repeat protein